MSRYDPYAKSNSDDGVFGLVLAAAVIVLLAIVLFLAILRGEWWHDAAEERCATINAGLYCQDVYKGEACFCQRVDGALVPIPEIP